MKHFKSRKNRTAVRFLRFLSFARGQYLRGPQKATWLFGERRNARLERAIAATNYSKGGCERIGVHLDEAAPPRKIQNPARLFGSLSACQIV
ncbi:MAG TPA: hypothetical protein IAD23_03870 [Candidatus Scubalenecus merdavium]|uniref:Uncharacterized protein n=1 Tax=Candidatus Scybalenecus merdavium TaxID=2840939 RepID=A0A9D1MUL9_9FIRM|nr:hypothetical protein [Candidatus Scubalenecus merdavium]